MSVKPKKETARERADRKNRHDDIRWARYWNAVNSPHYFPIPPGTKPRKNSWAERRKKRASTYNRKLFFVEPSKYQDNEFYSYTDLERKILELQDDKKEAMQIHSTEVPLWAQHIDNMLANEGRLQILKHRGIDTAVDEASPYPSSEYMQDEYDRVKQLWTKPIEFSREVYGIFSDCPDRSTTIFSNVQPFELTDKFWYATRLQKDDEDANERRLKAEETRWEAHRLASLLPREPISLEMQKYYQDQHTRSYNALSEMEKQLMSEEEQLYWNPKPTRSSADKEKESAELLEKWNEFERLEKAKQIEYQHAQKTERERKKQQDEAEQRCNKKKLSDAVERARLYEANLRKNPSKFHPLHMHPPRPPLSEVEQKELQERLERWQESERLEKTRERETTTAAALKAKRAAREARLKEAADAGQARLPAKQAQRKVPPISPSKQQVTVPVVVVEEQCSVQVLGNAQQIVTKPSLKRPYLTFEETIGRDDAKRSLLFKSTHGPHGTRNLKNDTASNTVVGACLPQPPFSIK
jgi:hypothetical protein